MYVVLDYGDRICADQIAANVRLANYRREDSLFMGPWNPLMQMRGFPETDGKNVLDLLYEKIKAAGEKVDYICMGQLTTLACLLFTHPEVTEVIKHIMLCPGEQNRNRDYPGSEENILSDPVASKIVMNADVTKLIMAEGMLPAQYKTLEHCLSTEALLEIKPSVFVTVILDKGCTYGSLYIDRLNICKKKPNSVLIGGYYDGKNPDNH